MEPCYQMEAVPLPDRRMETTARELINFYFGTMTKKSFRASWFGIHVD